MCDKEVLRYGDSFRQSIIYRKNTILRRSIFSGEILWGRGVTQHGMTDDKHHNRNVLPLVVFFNSFDDAEIIQRRWKLN